MIEHLVEYATDSHSSLTELFAHLFSVHDTADTANLAYGDAPKWVDQHQNFPDIGEDKRINDQQDAIVQSYNKNGTLGRAGADTLYGQMYRIDELQRSLHDAAFRAQHAPGMSTADIRARIDGILSNWPVLKG